MLQRGGYEIKILNTINFKQSMRYNPFKYIYCENNILKLVNCIMENTKGEDSKGGEDFWAKAEALYYQALIAYIWYTDMTFNFISAMAYTQMFNVLCDRALQNGGALPIHVTCLLDEFANQKIPNFQHLISVIRSREISAHIVVQTQSQLKAVYKDHAETIIGNCSCVLFLGGKERSTLKELSETLGRETIDLYNISDTRGSQRSMGVNYQKLGKELMSTDELAVMDNGKRILQVQDVRPFFSTNLTLPSTRSTSICWIPARRTTSILRSFSATGWR